MKTAKLTSLGMGLLLAGFLGGCGSGDDPGSPVKEAPLEGTVNAQAFSAKSALVTVSSSNGASVTIYDKAVTCSDRFSNKGPEILLTIEKDNWKDGASYQLGGSQDTPFGIPLPRYSVTFVSDSGSGTKNTIVSKGRVEVVKVSSKGVDGTLRLRADGGEQGSVEGQVTLTHCE